MYRVNFIALLFWVTTAECQSFSFTEMVNLTNYNTSKFNNYVSKRGFKPQEQEDNFTKYIFLDNKETTAEKCITKYNSTNPYIVSFDRLTAAEYADLKQKINAEGFTEGVLKGAEDTVLYQKNNITIYAVNERNENYYNLTVENKSLPKAKDIRYAEDLLALNAHEHIAAVYGTANVVKDVFITPDGKERNCSVLFPNSSREVVFIWSDEANYRNTQLIRIGGNAHTKSAQNYERPVMQNYWLSNQGIYIGMSLKELDKLNGNEIDFYGWDWNSGGTLASNNNGNLDFKKISLLLSCFNCSDGRYKRNKINSSTVALEEDRKIHVTTMVILPSNGE